MALPTKLTLEVVTPERLLVSEQVDEVQLPGAEGYFGVLPGHTPLLATLKEGELWYRIGGQKQTLPVTGGFVEVLPERVTVLSGKVNVTIGTTTTTFESGGFYVNPPDEPHSLTFAEDTVLQLTCEGPWELKYLE